MNKELIELQRGCNATCIVILEEYCKELGQALIMDARIPDEYLFAPLGKPIFKEKLDKIANNKNLTYFVIKGISEIDIESQNRFVGLVKDREFSGYKFPENVIIALTVKNHEKLQKISKELYHFCVVAF